jgi:acetyl esterase
MTLHPQAQKFLEMAEAAGGPPLSEMTVEQARGLPPLLGQLVGEGPQIANVHDIEIPGPAGAIPARVYEPENPVGTVVYIHGGGWVVGGLDDWDAVLRMLANDSGARVVSVDYRLAPEHPYPAAVEDVDAAVRWVASELAGGQPIVVAGDSAGGNLTAVASLHARESGPQIALQVLIYPVVDADTSSENYDRFRDTHLFLNTPDMEWFWGHYLGDGDPSDPDVSPLRAESLAGLPPAYVIVAGYDPLTEDALKYAKRLEDEGVPVTVARYDDQMHAFLSMANFIDTGNAAIADIGKAVKQALTKQPA